MAKGTPPVVVIAAQAPGSKVWHIEQPAKLGIRFTACGKAIGTGDKYWVTTFNLQDGDRLCKHCLRKLEASLGGRCQIVRIGD